MKRRLAWTGLLLAASLFSAGNARAQAPENHGLSEEVRNQSHVSIEFEGTDFNQYLSERINQLHSKKAIDRKELMKDAQEFLNELRSKDSRNPEIQAKLKEVEEDPLFQKLLQQGNLQKDKLPPKDLQQLSEKVKSLRESMKTTPSGQSPQGPGDSQRGLVNADPSQERGGPNAKENMPNNRPLMGMQSGPVSPSQPDQPTPEQKLTRWLRKNLDVKGPLADSPAVQEAVRELRHARSSPEPAAANDNGWLGQVSRFSQSLTKNDLWSKVNWPNLGKWQPSVSSRSLPHVRSPSGSSSFEGVPSVGLPSATAINWGLQFLWVGLIVAAGVLVWKLLGNYGPASGRSSSRAWNLGPWPVAPGAVGTRQDVVRAFEYLSLLKLGPASQSRNHLHLAAELGEPQPEHQGAAHRLATIYEKARYTPADESLSDAALASARREICYLAGIEQP